MKNKHKKLTLFFSIWLFANNSLPVVAQGNSESANWHLSLDFDYLAVGNGNSGLRPIADSICTHPNYIGSCTDSTTTASSASGFRASAFHKYAEMEMGPSVGVLNGGPGAGNITLLGPNGATLNYGTSANTVRFLGEVHKTWGFAENFSVRIGAGLGLATVNRVNSCYNGGTLNFGCTKTGVPNYSNMGWLTWELSPALVYRNMSLGVRYVGFGRGGQIPWNTPGAFLGVDF